MFLLQRKCSNFYVAGSIAIIQLEREKEKEEEEEKN